MIKRIALVGASSTGKTTAYNLLKETLPNYRFVNESTRHVATYGFPINEEGTSETQLAISSFHLEALLESVNTVYDRCYMDLVVYTSLLNNVSENVFQYINSIYEKVKNEYTHYIYFPIEFDAIDDGVRSVDEKWRQDVDKEFYENLKELGKNYLTVTGTPQERVNQIIKFISN